MRALTHKTLRDLRRQRAQVVAVAITVMLGVALFIASGGAYQNLRASYEYTYDRLNFADLIATGGDPHKVADAATAAGATAVTIRTQLDPPMDIGGTKLVGRVIGLPGHSQPQVDGVDVVSGNYLDPADPTGVLLEQHAADTFGLHPGDDLRVFANGSWRAVTVRGVVVSPEYLWPARSRQDVLTDPHSFAVVFADQQTLQHWSGTGPNQVLARVDGDGTATADGSVAQQLRAAGALDVTDRDDQPSHATLKEDLDGFNEMSVAFPLLFLTAAGIAAYVLLARRVLAERPIIGTLMACGARRGRLVRHYLWQGGIVGLTGAVAGVVLGVLGTGGVTRAYTDAFGIPDTIVHLNPGYLVAGLLFGVLVGLAGALAPAVTAARTVPAQAMRNDTGARPPGPWSRFVAHLRPLPVSWRMALRDVGRSRRRTLATMLGTVLSLVLVLASIGMMTSMIAAVDLQFGQIDKQDATVVADPATADATRQQLEATPGVTAVEQTITTPVTAANDGHSYTTTLTGYAQNTVMHGFRTPGGDWTQLPAEGILAGRSLADELHIAVGDHITLSTPDGRSTDVTLAGLVDEPLGTVLYANTTVAQHITGTGIGPATFLLRFTDNVDDDTQRQTVTSIPGVVAYTSTGGLLSQLDQYLGLFWAFIGMMVILGAVLALTVIYVTMAVNVVERTNELATLRAAGVPLRRVGAVLATENLAATTLGLPIGLAAGFLAAKAFLASFSNDLFTFELNMGWWALLLAALGVLLAAALSQWPAVRAVRRLDIARVVRERAQ
ncbi:FtsX-like permease family protein [Hamadaea sp. NPDC050747]|uniref:ABC transporter permease n=1 Tax=Hamadaea sp. NPDC050747 TaxID=3155789 RepID=UPI0033D7B656